MSAGRRKDEIGDRAGNPCGVCGRSCLWHPSNACRACRAGKPREWKAPKSSWNEVAVLDDEPPRKKWREVPWWLTEPPKKSEPEPVKETAVSTNGTTTAAETESPRYATFTCACGRGIKGLGGFNRHAQACSDAIAAGRAAPPPATKRHAHPPAPPREARPALDDERPAAPVPILAGDTAIATGGGHAASGFGLEDAELAALTRCWLELGRLTPESRARALGYLSARFAEGA